MSCDIQYNDDLACRAASDNSWGSAALPPQPTTAAANPARDPYLPAACRRLVSWRHSPQLHELAVATMWRCWVLPAASASRSACC